MVAILIYTEVEGRGEEDIRTKGVGNGQGEEEGRGWDDGLRPQLLAKYDSRRNIY